ncbi:MAG: cysteine--tRNA ligase [Clostridiales bacterium]
MRNADIPDLKLYNTMLRKIEKFIPISNDIVGMYTCGPTVYNFAHIGNLRMYIFEDILKRVLLINGYNIKHVMNVTDVGHLVSDDDNGEDKMEVGAKRENKTAFEIADFYFEAFKKDLSRLSIINPSIWCKATQHIKEQIAFVEKLESKGYTYVSNDGVYFDTSKLNNYGELAKLDLEGLKEGARVESNNQKKNITDFALWKFSPKDVQRQMEWDSPWGKGFPGWHIECSAMAMKYLGEQFDIHCGGIDHIPVHHTNEIAQSESITNKKWVNTWLHGEFLILEGNEKMAKSGKFITLETLIEKNINPLVYRYFCMNAHYRKALIFSWESLKAAENAYKRLCSKVIALKEKLNNNKHGEINEKYYMRFLKAINNDLNIPLSVASLWDMINDNEINDNDKYKTLIEMDKVLGLNIENMEVEKINIDEEIINLVEKRNIARKNKDYATADLLRKEIENKGYILEDLKDKVNVKLKN